MDDFDFDYWAQLAVKDPANFDRLKKEFLLKEIEKMQATSTQKQELTALATELSKKSDMSPKDSMMHANALMMQSLNSLNQGMQALQAEVSSSCDVTSKYTTLSIQKK